MTQQQQKEAATGTRDITMAERALAAYDEHGELELIKVLGQLAHSAQRHETWRDAGVCVLEDGTAVIQERHYYEFRWADQDGKATGTQRHAWLPAEERRFRWFYHGPLQNWPAGDSVWQDVDELLTARALDLLDEMDVEVNHVTDGDQSEIPVVTFMQACPQLGALLDAATQKEPELPDWLANTIGDHIREIAYGVIENLHEDDLKKAVNAVVQHLVDTAPNNED